MVDQVSPNKSWTTFGPNPPKRGYQSHSIGPFINKSSPHRMLPHLHQNIIPQWKHQIQSSKEKAVIIKIEGDQVSIEKLRYVFLTTYALNKTKHPNIHITKPMTLRVLRQIKFNLIDIQSVSNQLLLPGLISSNTHKHIDKEAIKTKIKNQIKHHHAIMRKLTKSNST